MRIRTAVFGAAFLGACQSSPGSDQASVEQQGEAARTAIAEINARWMRYVHEGKPDSIATLYTADGIAMPPDVPAATGADSIAARLRALIVPGGTLTITSQDVAVSGSTAVSRGVWTYVGPAQGGSPALNLKGKYMEHLRNVNGQWLITQNIWNTDAPAPRPQPAATGRR